MYNLRKEKNRVFFLVLTILLIGYSCKKDFNNLDTIDLTKFTLDGKKLIMSEKELLTIYGEPTSKIDSCSTQGKKKLSECWVYEGTDLKIDFQLHSDSAFIRQVYFRLGSKTDYELKSPEITLSEKTTLNDMKKRFPNSYRVRNDKMFNARSVLKQYDIIRLKDGTSQERRVVPTEIVLQFEDGKLKKFEYFYNPRIPKEDWSEKLQERKEEFKKARNRQ